MKNGDWGYSTFTILDRVKEIEIAIANKMYQSALALALTLPDICGKAEMHLKGGKPLVEKVLQDQVL